MFDGHDRPVCMYVCIYIYIHIHNLLYHLNHMIFGYAYAARGTCRFSLRMDLTDPSLTFTTQRQLMASWLVEAKWYIILYDNIPCYNMLHHMLYHNVVLLCYAIIKQSWYHIMLSHGVPLVHQALGAVELAPGRALQTDDAHLKRNHINTNTNTNTNTHTHTHTNIYIYIYICIYIYIYIYIYLYIDR